MAPTSRSKKNPFYFLKAPFRTKRLTPCCYVHKCAPGELLVKVQILQQVKKLARFSARNKQINPKTFLREMILFIWKRYGDSPSSRHKDYVIYADKLSIQKTESLSVLFNAHSLRFHIILTGLISKLEVKFRLC